MLRRAPLHEPQTFSRFEAWLRSLTLSQEAYGRHRERSQSAATYERPTGDRKLCGAVVGVAPGNEDLNINCAPGRFPDDTVLFGDRASFLCSTCTVRRVLMYYRGMTTQHQASRPRVGGRG